jgi:hypothetical protein
MGEGSVINGPYTLGARLGADDISEYYAARRARLEVNQRFVVRLLTTEAAQSRPTVETFIVTAQQLSKARRVDIDICDFGTFKSVDGDRGRPYMVFTADDDGTKLLTALEVRFEATTPMSLATPES